MDECKVLASFVMPRINEISFSPPAISKLFAPQKSIEYKCKTNRSAPNAFAKVESNREKQINKNYATVKIARAGPYSAATQCQLSFRLFQLQMPSAAIDFRVLTICVLHRRSDHAKGDARRE